MLEEIGANDDFKIAHDGTERKEIMHRKFNDYTVKFELKRGDQTISFPIHVSGDNVTALQTTKLAAHLLHEDLVRLAEQTVVFKLSPEELKEIILNEEQAVRPRPSHSW